MLKMENQNYIKIEINMKKYGFDLVLGWKQIKKIIHVDLVIIFYYYNQKVDFSKTYFILIAN